MKNQVLKIVFVLFISGCSTENIHQDPEMIEVPIKIDEESTINEDQSPNAPKLLVELTHNGLSHTSSRGDFRNTLKYKYGSNYNLQEINYDEEYFDEVNIEVEFDDQNRLTKRIYFNINNEIDTTETFNYSDNNLVNYSRYYGTNQQPYIIIDYKYENGYLVEENKALYHSGNWSYYNMDYEHNGLILKRIHRDFFYEVITYDGHSIYDLKYFEASYRDSQSELFTLPFILSNDYGNILEVKKYRIDNNELIKTTTGTVTYDDDMLPLKKYYKQDVIFELEFQGLNQFFEYTYSK